MLGFLHRAAAMAARALPAMAELLHYEDAERDLRVWLSMACAIWLLRLAAGLVGVSVSSAWSFLLSEVATFVLSAYGSFYVGLLLIWLFNQLNVWWLLLLLLLLQDFRSNDPPWLARLTAATGSFALYSQARAPVERKHRSHGH